MIKEAVATGATVEEAIKNATAELAAPALAEVHTEIVTMPTKKILGLFGGTPAKARAWYDAPEEAVAPAEPKAAPKQKAKVPAEKQNIKPKAEKPQAKQAPVQQGEAVAVTAEEENTAVDISKSASLTSAVNYLQEILKGMGVAQVDIKAFRTAEDEIILELDCGEDYGIVIGRRGETLDSIQYLTRLVANKKKEESEYLRISINVGNYREKRKTTLRELAKKNSEKVLKYGRNVTFEPMNPYERRIIHTAVQEIEGVTSYSVGTDANRRVVIALAEGYKATNPSRGGYNRRGGKGGYNRGGKGRSNNRRPSSAASTSAPARAPRTDAGAEKVSLYGKIN